MTKSKTQMKDADTQGVSVENLRPHILRIEGGLAALEVISKSVSDNRLGMALESIAETFCSALGDIHELT